MGMFTIVFHPKDGRELQIKTGHDDLDEYILGDTVERHINPDHYGYGCCFDGIYPSYSIYGEDSYVVIKDQKILAIEDLPVEYETLYNKYAITPLDHSIYTPEAHRKHYELVEKIEKESKEFEESIKNLSPEEQLAKRMMQPFVHATELWSIGRAILGLDKGT